MEQTNFPWKCTKEQYGNDGEITDKLYTLWGNVRHIDADTEAADYIGEVHGAANAAYIVRACNNFEELLSVAKILLADCEENIAAMGECDHSVGICLCGFKSNVAIAKEVIQKAEATE